MSKKELSIDFKNDRDLVVMLSWPRENTGKQTSVASRWFHSGSNLCLDFHGDPSVAPLRVFSDGNHHMALEAALESFRVSRDLQPLFYCTTPPKVYLDWIATGIIELGNLQLSCTPDIVIGPDDIITSLVKKGVVTGSQVFAQSVGNDLLVTKGNPLDICEISDLLREDVRLFMSNPHTEKASYTVYRDTIEAMTGKSPADERTIDKLVYPNDMTHFGSMIHHREAPQALADDRADVALLYSHLALRYSRIFSQKFERIELQRGPNNITTKYAIGMVDGKNELARELVRYFSKTDVAAHYRYHGLLPATN